MPVKRTHNKNAREGFRKGFLLPDVMIAVFVTASALVATLAAIAPSIKLEAYKRDEIIATGLAQEGIELVRNVRDNNWKMCDDGNSFPCTGSAIPRDAFFSSSFPTSNTNNGVSHCADASTGALHDPGCALDSNSSKLYRSNGGVYTHSASSGNVSKFKRTVTVKTPAANDTREITSTVTWGSGASAHSVTLTDTLTNWGNK